MSACSRIWSTDGKATDGEKHFGITLKDRQTTPNVLQTTFIPQTGRTIQDTTFNIENYAASPDLGVTPAMLSGGFLTLSPDFTLIADRKCHFEAFLTITFKTNSTTKISGHYKINTAAIGNAIMCGTGGYRLDIICAENTLEDYIDDYGITLTVQSNKFVITMSPKIDIPYSVDMAASIKIVRFDLTA